jgi:hypothetical protein
VKVFYFGCWDAIGHFLWTPSGVSVPLSTTPWGNAVDTGLCPGKRDRRGEVACENQWEGEAACNHMVLYLTDHVARFVRCRLIVYDR